MIIGYDLHTHTSFSDGRDPVILMAEAAIDRGMHTLGISDHAPVPWENEWCIERSRITEQGRELERARREVEGRLTLLWGTELDLCSDIDETPYDYLIGSTHTLALPGARRSVDESESVMLDTVETYFGGNYYAYTRRYFEELARWAKRDIDILGHVDVVTKFNEGNRYFDEEDFRYLRPAEDAIAAIAAKGHIFELNSGAVARGYRKTPYPSMQLLKMIRAHGGRILLSSDAHDSASICFMFGEMEKMAGACGFTSVMAPSETGRPFVERPIF